MLLVGKDVKYASSGNVLNAALTPDLLDAGSIGIYAIGSDGKLKLVVTAATSPATGLILADALTAQDKITMFQGLGSGSQLTSETHQVGGIKNVLGSKYRAGTAQTVYVGYNPVTGVGDLNLVMLPIPGAGSNGLTYTDPDLLYRQQCSINFKSRLLGNNEFGNHHYITVPVAPTDTAQTIVAKLVAQANTIQTYDSVQYFTALPVGNFLATPVQTQSVAALSGGTVPDASYYSTVVYYGANGNSLGSNEIKVVAASTSANQSTLTFNWGVPPTGTTSSRVFVSTTPGVYSSYYNVASSTTHTLTITALGSPVTGTIPTATATGISLTAINKVISTTAFFNDENPFSLYAVSVFGVIGNATVDEGGVIEPSGAPWQIRKIEKTSMSYRGDLNTLSLIDRGHIPSQVDFTATYDLYQVITNNITADKTGARSYTDQVITTHIAFIVQGNTLGTDQQAEFEDILTSIFPTTPQISA